MGVGAAGPGVWVGSGTLKSKEMILTWSLQREHNPDDTLTSASTLFWTADLQNCIK